jgi:CNT family concentrative nucleoside transporter
MQSTPLLYNLISLGGLLAVCALAWLCGHERRRVRWSAVGWGLLIQLALGFLVFTFPPGRAALLWINDAVVGLLNAARAGLDFMFGPLALGPDRAGSLGFILATQALPTVVFFMAFSALLYQAGILQRVVNLFSRLFVRLLGTSGAESMAAAANVFVGVEVAGMVRPFLAGMTRSEFFCLLTASMANVASSTLGVYVAALQPHFPNIAGHLVSASVISAPAAIIIAKIMEPETGEPVTAGRLVDPEVGRYPSWMEALIAGTQDGMKLLVGIAGLLLSFLGLVALANALLGWGCSLLGLEGLELGGLLGYLAWPLTLAMGVPPADALAVARLLGERALVTEIPAYMDLAKLLAQGQFTYARSALVASYALCGFTHVGAVAIFVGGFASLVPERMGELAGLGLKSLWAATLATVMVGCVAGVFAAGGATVLGLAP